MFPLHFHYEDVSRQDLLLKPNHAIYFTQSKNFHNVGVPKAAPSDCIIKNEKKKSKSLLVKSSVRRFIIIHVTAQQPSIEIDENFCFFQIKKHLLDFNVIRVIISKEKKGSSVIFHIGIETSNASKHRYKGEITKIFPKSKFELKMQAKKGEGAWVAELLTNELCLVSGAGMLELLNIKNNVKNHEKLHKDPQEKKRGLPQGKEKDRAEESLPTFPRRLISFLRKRGFHILKKGGKILYKNIKGCLLFLMRVFFNKLIGACVYIGLGFLIYHKLKLQDVDWSDVDTVEEIFEIFKKGSKKATPWYQAMGSFLREIALKSLEAVCREKGIELIKKIWDIFF